MSPRFRALAIFTALYLVLAPEEAMARRAPKPAYAAFLEVLGGAAGGIALGIVGGAIGSATGTCSDSDPGFFGECGDKFARAMLGALAGYTVGAPLGIWMTGNGLRQGGSGAGVVVGTFMGELAAIPLLFAPDSRLALPVILLIPPAAGTFAYHAFADPAPAAAESESSFMESATSRMESEISPMESEISPMESEISPMESETAARWRASADPRFAAPASPAGTRGSGLRIPFFRARF